MGRQIFMLTLTGVLLITNEIVESKPSLRRSHQRSAYGSFSGFENAALSASSYDSLGIQPSHRSSRNNQKAYWWQGPESPFSEGAAQSHGISSGAPKGPSRPQTVIGCSGDGCSSPLFQAPATAPVTSAASPSSWPSSSSSGLSCSGGCQYFWQKPSHPCSSHVGPGCPSGFSCVYYKWCSDGVVLQGSSGSSSSSFGHKPSRHELMSHGKPCGSSGTEVCCMVSVRPPSPPPQQPVIQAPSYHPSSSYNPPAPSYPSYKPPQEPNVQLPSYPSYKPPKEPVIQAPSFPSYPSYPSYPTPAPKPPQQPVIQTPDTSYLPPPPVSSPAPQPVIQEPDTSYLPPPPVPPPTAQPVVQEPDTSYIPPPPPPPAQQSVVQQTTSVYYPPSPVQTFTTIRTTTKPPITTTTPRTTTTTFRTTTSRPRPPPTQPVVAAVPQGPPANTIPYPGCAAALKCVLEEYCSIEGIMVNTPVFLTEQQKQFRVPLMSCLNTETNEVGFCCRDPLYKDPWPAGMPMPMPTNPPPPPPPTAPVVIQTPAPPAFLQCNPAQECLSAQVCAMKLGQFNSQTDGPCETFDGQSGVCCQLNQPRPSQPVVVPPLDLSYLPPPVATTTTTTRRPTTQAVVAPPQELIPPTIEFSPSEPVFVPQVETEYLPPPPAPVVVQPLPPSRPASPPVPAAQVAGDQCGISRPIVQTLANGEAALGEFPWHAMIAQQNGSMSCSGALIGPKFVATAFHCVHG